MNPDSKFGEGDLEKMRKAIAKECYNEQLRKIVM